MAYHTFRILLVEGPQSKGGSSAQRLAGEPEFAVTRVERLTAAIAHLDHAAFDAILLDLTAGHPPGYGAIDRLHARLPDLAVIGLVDPAEAEDDELICSAIRCGAQDVVAKDQISTAVLRHAIVGAIERKRVERRRLRYAREDELTGLANRTLLEERFSRAVARADREGSMLGIVAIELAYDTRVGYEQRRPLGDRLLRAAAERLVRLSQSTDTLARTRPRGFTWLVEGLSQVDEINVLADRLTELIEPGFRLDQLDLHQSASAGVAFYPLHGRRFSELHAIAEAAMSDVASISGNGYLIAPLSFRAGDDRQCASAA